MADEIEFDKTEQDACQKVARRALCAHNSHIRPLGAAADDDDDDAQQQKRRRINIQHMSTSRIFIRQSGAEHVPIKHSPSTVSFPFGCRVFCQGKMAAIPRKSQWINNMSRYIYGYYFILKIINRFTTVLKKKLMIDINSYQFGRKG